METYAFQGQIFDTLSPEYQEQYLAWRPAADPGPGLHQPGDPGRPHGGTGEDAFQPETQEAIQAQMDQIGAMMDSWKARDAAKFDAVYGKDVILDSEDELNRKLFTGRDPGMIQYAADYLNQTGSHTGLLVVGAGHMVGTPAWSRACGTWAIPWNWFPSPEQDTQLVSEPLCPGFGRGFYDLLCGNRVERRLIFSRIFAGASVEK